MEMNTDERNYLLSLTASALTDREVQQVFEVIVLLDEDDSAQPQTMKGKRVTVDTFLSLLKHAKRL